MPLPQEHSCLLPLYVFSSVVRFAGFPFPGADFHLRRFALKRYRKGPSVVANVLWSQAELSELLALEVTGVSACRQESPNTKKNLETRPKPWHGQQRKGTSVPKT